MGDTPQQFMTPDEVANLLQVPVATLYGWRYKGVGPLSVRVGKHIRYRRADIDAWFDRRGQSEKREAER